MHGEYKMPGGKLVVIDLSVRDALLADVQLSGDFFLEPDNALAAINRALCGLPADSSADAIAQAVQSDLPADAMLFGISPQAIAEAVRRALHTGDDA